MVLKDFEIVYCKQRLIEFFDGLGLFKSASSLSRMMHSELYLWCIVLLWIHFGFFRDVTLVSIRAGLCEFQIFCWYLVPIRFNISSTALFPMFKLLQISIAHLACVTCAIAKYQWITWTLIGNTVVLTMCLNVFLGGFQSAVHNLASDTLE